MIWLEFFGSTVLIVIAARFLARYGDVISVRTGLGGVFIGTLLMAGATSLPELLTAVNAINQDAPSLTVGNIFGSSMFNMFLLAVVDLLFYRVHILRRVTINHAVSASLAVLIHAAAVFFILAEVDLSLGWVGIDSLVLIGVYIVGTRILVGNGDDSDAEEAEEIPEETPSLRHALIGFAAAALALLLLTPILVSSSIAIAEETGLGTGFVGVALVGIVTSLPEVMTTISAARIGAYDLAIGNLFGSNLFNVFALGLVDFFFTDGRFLAEVSPAMTIAGMLALVMTTLALLGNLARHLTRGGTRRLLTEIDALLIAILYVLGMLLLYDRNLIG